MEGHHPGTASLEAAEGDRVESEVTTTKEVTITKAKEGGGGTQVEDSLPEEHPATHAAAVCSPVPNFSSSQKTSSSSYH